MSNDNDKGGEKFKMTEIQCYAHFIKNGEKNCQTGMKIA